MPRPFLAWKRMLPGVVVVTVWQFAVLLWFLVGQGYDRSTALSVVWASWVLPPLLALPLMTGVADIEGHWPRYRVALSRSLLLAAFGVWGPGVLVVSVMPLTSPFAELWWLLTGTTFVAGTLTLVWQRLRSAPQRLVFALLVTSAVLGWRHLLFSFF